MPVTYLGDDIKLKLPLEGLTLGHWIAYYLYLSLIPVAKNRGLVT